MSGRVPVSRAHPARAVRVAHPDGELVLRPVGATDTYTLIEAIDESLDALKQWMPWAHLPNAPTHQAGVLRGFEASYFAGQDMAMGLFRGGELLTMVGLHPRVPLNPAGLEVGYWTRTSQAGRGWASFAVRVAATYAFDRLGCDRLQVVHDEENTASRRVIEKCGFTQEGRLARYAAEPTEELRRGGLRSSGHHLMWAMLPDGFEAQPWTAEVRAAIRYVDLTGREE